MKRGVLIMMLICMSKMLLSQNNGNLYPRILGFGKILNDALSANELVAQTCHAEKILFGIGVENRYAIQHAAAGAFAMLIPKKNNFLSAGISTDGLKNFRNWSLQIGEAMKVNENLSIGLKLHTHATQIKGNKSLVNIGYQLGMSYNLSEATQCHFHFSNTRFLFTDYNENMQGIYQMIAGIAQQINPDLLVACSIEQSKGSPIAISPEITWMANKNYLLIAGLKPLPGELFMGISWTRTKHRMMLIVSHHPYLGNSFAYRYNFEKN